MILTPTQRAAFQRAVAKANEVLPLLDALSELAAIDTSLQQRHDELRTARDLLHRVSTKALQIDSMSGR